MVLDQIVNLNQNKKPLKFKNLPVPQIRDHDILVRVTACGVCHTELDEIEGRTPPPSFPVIPGHQVVGIVAEVGAKCQRFKKEERVGIAWIFYACGACKFCLAGEENLCIEFLATGRDANGGYAEYMSVPEQFAYPIPKNLSDAEAAPLLCAGAIGFRSLRLTNLQDGQHLGLTGFGASAHLVLKLVKFQFPQAKVFVFARSEKERKFALDLGADWVGDTLEVSPLKLDAIIDTTPVWKPVVAALHNLEAGGRLVINAIRKEEIDKDYLLNMNYPNHLWLEKEIKSVANVTRRDVSEFLDKASKIPIIPEIQTYRLEEVNKALIELKERQIRGAKVLVMD